MSDLSDYGRTHVGCVIGYGKNVIATGFNSHKTSPLQKAYNRCRCFEEYDTTPHSLHAEIAAISSVKHLDVDWSKAEIYVYRKLKNGDRSYARPCAGCMKAISDLGIKNIFYSTPDGFAHEQIDLNNGES